MQYLRACLDSLACEMNVGCEVILIDNASTDGSYETICTHYPQYCCTRNSTNNGFAAACNQGAALAQGDFLVFLNQDTRVCPGWLEGLLEPLRRDPAVGLATSKVLLMSRPGQINMCGQDIHFSGLAFARGLLRPPDEFDKAGPVSSVSGAAFAIRRTLWQHLGGFDERLFMYYEETDLCWRAWQAGYASYFTPHSLVYHDFGLRSSSKALYYSARNRWVLLLKHWRLPALLLLSPGLLLAELAEWGLMLINGRQGLSAKLRAYGWLARNIPGILRSRKSSLRTRTRPDWYLLHHCTATLAPKIHRGGWVGKILLVPMNFLFWLNYRTARLALRWLEV